jgi:hypothetical protein
MFLTEEQRIILARTCSFAHSILGFTEHGYQLNDIFLAYKNVSAKLILSNFSCSHYNYFTAKLKQFRDATEANVGIVLLGTNQFKTKMDTWQKKEVQGIPELCSRIYSWIDIPTASDNEKLQILKQNGIADPTDVRELVKKSSDLRKLYQNVLEYRFNKGN